MMAVEAAVLQMEMARNIWVECEVLIKSRLCLVEGS